MKKETYTNKGEYIKTMSKETFDKLTPAKKRIAVAKDVIDRIELGQLKPQSGDIFSPIRFLSSGSAKDALKNPMAQCHVCAKGGLFMAFVGITNNYNLGNTMHEHLDGDEMSLLSDVFSRKQLTLIETAYEGTTYSWNDDLERTEVQACVRFQEKYYDSRQERGGEHDKQRLIAICRNIIKNNGTFKP